MSVDFSKSHPVMDRREHERTYTVFVKAIAISLVGTLVVLALMAMFLT